MKKLLFALCLLAFLLSMSSCTFTKAIYTGNIHQSDVGKSKNEMLRTYGVPDRVTEDGTGGEVLVYEKLTTITSTNSTSSTTGQTNTYGAAAYGKGGVVAATYSKSGEVTNGSSLTKSSNEKEYVNLFVGKNGIVYDFKANTGGLYKYEKCFNKKVSKLAVVYYGIVFPPSLCVTLPLYFIKKKKYSICN